MVFHKLKLCCYVSVSHLVFIVTKTIITSAALLVVCATRLMFACFRSCLVGTFTVGCPIAQSWCNNFLEHAPRDVTSQQTGHAQGAALHSSTIVSQAKMCWCICSPQVGGQKIIARCIALLLLFLLIVHCDSLAHFGLYKLKSLNMQINFHHCNTTLPLSLGCL